MWILPQWGRPRWLRNTASVDAKYFEEPETHARALYYLGVAALANLWGRDIHVAPMIGIE